MISVADIDIVEGATKRMDCPSCKGKNTFTVSKLNGVLIWNCYKLGCNARGASMVGMTAAEIKATLASRQATAEAKLEVDAPTMELPLTLTYDISNKLTQGFITRWQLQGVPMLYDIVSCRAVFPIHSKKGRLIDAVGRTLRGDVPKWLRYSGNADYYRYGSGSVAVVVEDAISAAVVGKHIAGATGFAILGTSMNSKHFEALQQYNKVIVALDPDAWSKTLQFVQMLKGHSIKATAFKLSDDIKYMVDSDMDSLKLLVKR